MNNAQHDFILEAMKAELAAILLNAEGGLKKRLSTPMTNTQFKVLDAFFKMGLPTLPLCPHCASNVHVEFRYFNNRTKTRLVQPRFACKVCFAAPHSPEKEWTQKKQEEHVNKRKKLEFTLHQEELDVLAGAWGGLPMLLQRFWSTPRVIEVLETGKFTPDRSRCRKSESSSESSPKKRRRSCESKQVNNGDSIAQKIVYDEMPVFRDHCNGDMLWNPPQVN